MITHRILLVSACGSNEGRLELDRDERAIRESLRRCNHWQQFAISTCPAATVKDFRRGLLDWPDEDDGTQRIVHFIGHGSNRGFCFVDENNVTYEVDPQVLCDQLELNHVSLVIFANCHAEKAYRKLSFPYCVAMAGSVSDQSAIAFSCGFYDGVGAQRSIPRAFDEGVNNVLLLGGSLNVALYEKGVLTRRSQPKGGSAHDDPSAAGVPRRRPISRELESRLDSARSLLLAGHLDAAAKHAREALGMDPSCGRANLIQAAITLAQEEAFTLSGARAREVEAQLNVALSDDRSESQSCARVLLAVFKCEYYARNHRAETEPGLDQLVRAAEAQGGLTKGDAELASSVRLAALTRYRLRRLFETRKGAQ